MWTLLNLNDVLDSAIILIHHQSQRESSSTGVSSSSNSDGISHSWQYGVTVLTISYN